MVKSLEVVVFTWLYDMVGHNRHRENDQNLHFIWSMGSSECLKIAQFCIVGQIFKVFQMASIIIHGENKKL